MTHVLRLEKMVHGADFRALTLRDTGRTGAIDPVLGIDHAWMRGPTFPPHQHVGFSAVSYVFADAETGLSNEDSIGTKNLIRPGGLHWTAAGRGIVHEEVPTEPGKMAHLFQIFVNLPAAKQSAPPFALSLEPEDVPIVDLPGLQIRVVLGAFGEKRSPMTPPTALTLLDISMDADVSQDVPVAAGHNVFIVPVKGRTLINGVLYDADDARLPAFPAQATGQTVKIETQDDASQVVLFAGLPIRFQ